MVINFIRQLRHLFKLCNFRNTLSVRLRDRQVFTILESNFSNGCGNLPLY